MTVPPVFRTTTEGAARHAVGRAASHSGSDGFLFGTSSLLEGVVWNIEGKNLLVSFGLIFTLPTRID
jgi:hypothetical protein